MTKTTIQNLDELQLADLFYAYRKAKADCFFEHSICSAQEFALYEQNLAINLVNLLTQIKSGNISTLLLESLGALQIMAKKLSIKEDPNKEQPKGHGFFSDPKKAFARLNSSHTLTPEFRIVGDFPVQMHILSALWINLIGHKFDSVLSKSAYGSRLRRYRSTSGSLPGTVGEYHVEAVGSFEPYFGPYKRWREDGLRAIRNELAEDRPLIAVSMDLTSYYHKIDPSFISNPQFYAAAGIALQGWEVEFTQAYSNALSAWSKMASNALFSYGCTDPEAMQGGLPIGLTISRVVANALLVGLDRDIEQGLTPVFYGRYVDDIFLVLRDPGTLSDATDLITYLNARTSWFPKPPLADDDKIYLDLPAVYKGQTQLLLQQSKQKLFFLQGQGGLDLLNNIETQIRSVSSERRLMPSPDRLELMTSAKVLTAAGHPSEEADTLRRADGLAVRRLGWSIQLRAVETLARDLRQNDWKEERQKFYQFAHGHILRPDRILDHLDYLPRLLSLTVALMDWPEAVRLLNAAAAAVNMLEAETAGNRMKINGLEVEAANTEIWTALRESIRRSSAEATIRSLRWSQRHGVMRPLSDLALNLCEQVGLSKNLAQIMTKSLMLRECDLAKTPYKDHLRRDASRERPLSVAEEAVWGIYTHEKDLRDFLKKSAAAPDGASGVRINRRCAKKTKEEGSTSSLLPFLFPTRPYSTQEVSLFLPGPCIFGEDSQKPSHEWARFVRATRGVWVWSIDTEQVSTESNDDNQLVKIAFLGNKKANAPVRLGISNLLTTEDSFKASANGKSDLSPARYKRLEIIVNQAIEAYPRPTHLLLPELALPERWLDTVSGRLRDANISLIAGLDYLHTEPNQINSEAVLVLEDDRLGYPSSVQIRQPKSLPAAGEEETLLKFFGKQWPPSLSADKKPIYIHRGLCFGVLVCSELQNVSHRLGFQGNVDCTMILSWNQDLETFSALVESASLDVHAYIALVNNRKYGDSRVRAPAKQHHARDLCRLRGGENEHIVVVELNIERLRSFQSREKRWPSEADPYKPVPEGFRISPYRKTTPS